MANEGDGDFKITVHGFEVALPLGFAYRNAFPIRAARAEAIALLNKSACEKIAAGEALFPEERAVCAQVMAPLLEEEGRIRRIAARAEHVLEDEPKLLPARSEGDPEPAAPNRVWWGHWREGAKLESDQDVEEMWARVLAGQIARPGSFSLKALSVLRDLDTQTASSFVKLLGFSFGDGDCVPAWTGFKARYLALGISYTTLLRLAEVGLIHTQDALMQLDPAQSTGDARDVPCNGLVIRLPKVPEPVEARPLTIAGAELAKVANCPPNIAALTAMFEWLTQRMTGSDALVALRSREGHATSDFRPWHADELAIGPDGVVAFAVKDPFST